MTQFKIILVAGLLFGHSAAANEMFDACQMSGAPDGICGCVAEVSEEFLNGQHQHFFMLAAQDRMKIGDWVQQNLSGNEKADFDAAFKPFQANIKQKCDVSY